jgi:NADH:ubiquinone oxidoreductase subunit K
MEDKPDDNQGKASTVEQPALSTPKPASLSEEEKQTRRRLIYICLGALVIVAALIVAMIFLLQQPADTTGKVRDVFIIFMALESLVIGAALVILIVQLSILINLLQNEIKPILNSTNETVNTLRGTAVFLSDNLAEPIMKLNEYLAGLKKLVDLFRMVRK